MADVNIIPKICCDNCGKTVDKQQDRIDSTSKSAATFKKPGMWGSLKIEGGRDVDSYGMKARLVFVDLCPFCANTALDAAASALKAIRDGGDHG